MRKFILDKTLVLIGPVAGLVLACNCLLVNLVVVICHLQKYDVKTWGELPPLKILLSGYTSTFNKVCPGKIWFVHTYHNYINPQHWRHGW